MNREKSYFLIISLILFFQFGLSGPGYAKSNTNKVELYHHAVFTANQFKEKAQYFEAIKWLEKSLIYSETDWQEIDAKTQIAEILRILSEYEKGLVLLWSLNGKAANIKNDDVLLKFEIKRLGRIAAFHHENFFSMDQNGFDSVVYYVEKALVLCALDPLKHQEEEASLKNELGWRIFYRGMLDEARILLRESADTYKALGNDQDYTNVLNNLIKLEMRAGNEKYS